MRVIHGGSSPEAGLNTVALATGIGIVNVDDLDRFRLKRFHHVHVQAVAASADNDTLGCIITNNAFLSRSIDTGDGISVFN